MYHARMPAYRYVYNDEFLTEAVRRHHASQKLLSVGRVICLVVGLACMVLGVALWRQHDPRPLLAIGVIGLMLSGSAWYAEAILRRNFRRSPFRDQEVNWQISGEQLAITIGTTATTFDWSVVTRAHKFSDGFLLYWGPAAFHWLPNRFQVEGTPEDTEALLRAKVSDYR